MLIVNKTLNEVGFICEDYNGFTDEREEEVSKQLKTLQKSHNDEMTKHNMKPVKGNFRLKVHVSTSGSFNLILELYYNAMKQVDDGRPGMALELGMNFFANGNPILNVNIRTYNFSNRYIFAN